MLLPFKAFGLGLMVCLGFVVMGLMDLTKGLCRLVLASTLVALAPLAGLAAMVVVCARLAKGATSEELLEEFHRWNEKELRRRRIREIGRALGGVLRTG